MLKKLLKYDVKTLLSEVDTLYIVSIVLAIITGLFGLYNGNNIIIQTITKLLVIATICLLSGMILYSLSPSHFKESLYGSESYLTHTLPVSKKDIYNSKLISSAIRIMTSLLIACLVGFIVLMLSGSLSSFIDEINIASQELNINGCVVFLICVFILFVELLTIEQCIYFGIIKSNNYSDKKTIYTIVYSFILYQVIQVVIFVIIFALVFLFTGNNIFAEEVLSNSQTVMIFALDMILYIISNMIIQVVNQKQLNKGVNVE